MLVKELISDESKWCQGHTAKDCDGNKTNPQSKYACQWCLIGGIDACYSTASERLRARESIEQAIKKLFPKQINKGGVYIPAFNDCAIWEEVHAVLEEAGV